MQHNLAKIALSKEELELVVNAQILLTKNEIIKKVYSLFGVLSDHYTQAAQGKLSGEVMAIHAKISRGENYEGLPYVMLDYPRYFKKDSACAIRTFFWWGHFFSITLQLSGYYRETYLSKLQQSIKEGEFESWFINAGDNEWEHHYRESNYRPVKSNQELFNQPFIKLSTKIPLQEWDDVKLYLEKNFEKLLQVLSS